MEGQTDIYDAFLDTLPAPIMWECRKTCRHFGENVDYPLWWWGEARCLYPDTKTMKHAEFDNRCYIYCTLYEPKNKSGAD